MDVKVDGNTFRKIKDLKKLDENFNIVDSSITTTNIIKGKFQNSLS